MANEPYRLTQTGAEVQADLNDIEALGLATEETAGKMSAADKQKLDNLPSGSELSESLGGKVDKVTGKGLSTNDFTNADKAKVDSAYQKPDTGIPATDLASNAKPFVSGSGTGSAVLNGAGLQANGANEVAVGRNNFSPSTGTKNLFSIGVGANGYRNNALVVKENGKVYLLDAGYSLEEEDEYIVEDLATIVRQGYFNRLDVWDTGLMERITEVIGGVVTVVAYAPDPDAIPMEAGFERDGLQPFIFTALDRPIRLYSSQNTYHDYDISGKQVLIATLNWSTGYWFKAVVIGNPNADWNAQDGSDSFIKNKPSIPTALSELSEDATHRVVTDTEKATWNGKYTKPGSGIPASDMEAGAIPDVSNFITKSVDDLVNYYLKSETYTKTEVQNLIAAINQFHYEIYASTSAIVSPATNVLYLIGPTGTGADKYEEYVYSNNAFVKIGDTSIDLSNYVTTSALNTALADYTTTANLTTLLAGKQDTISDLSTIRTGAGLGATAVQPEAGKGLFSGSYNDLTDKPTIPDEVEANPTVPAGTTPSDLTGLKVGSDYYAIPEGGGGVGIDEVTQPVVSTENGGTNTVRITLTNGEHYDVQIRNGKSSVGLFPTASALETAYPNPSAGDYAFVGTGFPAEIYVCETAGTWEDSGEEYGGDSIDLTDFARQDDVDRLENEVSVIEGLAEVEEDGFFLVDEDLYIGFKLDNNGVHAKNLVGF